MEAAHIRWRPLGRLLVDQGLLSEDQLEHALDEQSKTGRRLGETLIDLGYVSHAALSHALAEQYGIEPKAETGFGTGLRAELERRTERDREPELGSGPDGHEPAPALRLVVEAEEPEPLELDADDALLAPLEEQWARLAAAEEQLAEAERELVALRRTAQRRRDQAVRLVERVRTRTMRIAELEASERPALDPSPPAVEPPAPLGHLVYAQVADRYVLVERDGVPPEPDTILELPELGEEPLLVFRVGRSPLPNDQRPCVLAQHAARPLD